MLRRDGYVKVLDFGLAKLASSGTDALGNELLADSFLKTDPGMVMGTVNYMSPEQARGLAVDARTDIWSFGVLFYEMLAGKTPFAGETPSHSIVATLDREPPPLSDYLTPVPARLNEIVSRSLRKNKEGRYRTANELLLDLQSLRQELEIIGHGEPHVRLTLPQRRDAETATNESEIADENQSAQRPLPLDSAQRTSTTAYFVNEIKRHWRGLLMAAAMVLIIVVTVLAFLPRASFWSAPPQPAATVRINSIAVLPFIYTSTDSADENLGLTIADTLISRLGNLREVAVRSPDAVRKFDVSNRDPAAAGRELRVEAVLDATMRRESDKIRIDLRLVNSADGATLWASQENDRIDSVAAMRDRIVERVALALGPYLNVLTKRYVQNGESYRLYMNGRYHWNQNTPQDLEKSLDYFNKAIEKDPNYAPAYAGIADIYTSGVADPLPKAETIPKARQAAAKAIALDDNLADAHVSLARIKAYYDWDWSGAEAEFRRAIELDSNSAFAHGEFGSWLAGMGRSDEAIAETKRALDLDPLSLHNNFYVIWALLSGRRYDEAIAHSQQVLPTFTQAHYWKGMGYLGKGMNAEAISEFEKRLTLDPKNDPFTRSNLAYAYGITGRRSEAEKTLAEFKELYQQRKVSAYFVAFICAGLGDKDQAFAWLEKAYQDHSRSLWGLKVVRGWDVLRTDPRFANLLQRLRLE
jgi:TolB-like protein/Tfp pilus assembly protein PilF